MEDALPALAELPALAINGASSSGARWCRLGKDCEGSTLGEHPSIVLEDR